jgi:hypothetical protein
VITFSGYNYNVKVITSRLTLPQKGLFVNSSLFERQHNKKEQKRALYPSLSKGNPFAKTKTKRRTYLYQTNDVRVYRGKG